MPLKLLETPVTAEALLVLAIFLSELRCGVGEVDKGPKWVVHPRVPHTDGGRHLEGECTQRPSSSMVGLHLRWMGGAWAPRGLADV